MKLLDTNICIAFLNGTRAAVRDRLLGEPSSELTLCSVVKAELFYGARNSSRVAQNLERLEAFFSPFQSLPFSDEAAERYGEIRTYLGRSGKLIGGNDMMIAAIALNHDATLVTANVSEFRRIAGLRLETWF